MNMSMENKTMAIKMLEIVHFAQLNGSRQSKWNDLNYIEIRVQI